MAKKKSPNNEVVPAKIPEKSQMRVKYIAKNYNWLIVLLSPEVLLASIAMGVSTYLLITFPCDMLPVKLWELSTENNYRLQNRDNEMSYGVPSFVIADFVLCVVASMSSCFFLSACCRVIMKAENKFKKEVLEEALRLHYNDEQREAKKRAAQKSLDETNAARAKKGLKPLIPYIETPYISGDGVMINIVAIICLIYSFVLIYFVLFSPLNQIRGFGVISMFSVLLGGIVLPKVYDDLLTLQHFCGLLQSIFALGLMFLCYVAMSQQVQMPTQF